MFTMVRAAAMTYVYMPLARLQGIRKPKPLMRFAEQAWGFTFAVTSWSSGLVRRVTHAVLDLTNDSVFLLQLAVLVEQ